MRVIFRYGQYKLAEVVDATRKSHKGWYLPALVNDDVNGDALYLYYLPEDESLQKLKDLFDSDEIDLDTLDISFFDDKWISEKFDPGATVTSVEVFKW